MKKPSILSNKYVKRSTLRIKKENSLQLTLIILFALITLTFVHRYYSAFYILSPFPNPIIRAISMLGSQRIIFFVIIFIMLLIHIFGNNNPKLMIATLILIIIDFVFMFINVPFQPPLEIGGILIYSDILFILKIIAIWLAYVATKISIKTYF